MEKSRLIGMLLLGPALLMSCNHGGVTTSGQDSSSSDVKTETSSEDQSSSETTTIVKEKRVCKILEVPEGIDLYKDAKLFVGEEEIPLVNVKVNDNHTYAFPDPSRVDSAVARIAIKGRVELTLKLNYDITTSVNVLPSSFRVIPLANTQEKEIKFTLYSAGKYVIQPNKDPLKAIHIFVDEYQENNELNIPDGYNLIHLKKGIHDSTNCRHINKDGHIVLDSNTVLQIDDGAVVRARIKAFGKKNIIIQGKGIVDGSTFSRKNAVVPIDFSHCNNIEIHGVTILDPAAWTVNLYFTNNAIIDDINIISSRANGDGITLQSCHNVHTTNCFVRGFDDNLVVKNYGSPYGTADPSKHGTTDNITFKDCFLWTDLAQSMEIGFETVGPTMKHITFDNITVFHNFSQPVISIHNANYANVSEVEFKNITVENAEMGTGKTNVNHLADISCLYSPAFSDKAVAGGSKIGNIDGVKISNVLVKNVRTGLDISFNIKGMKDKRMQPEFAGNISMTKNVSFTDIKVKDKVVTSEWRNIYKNQYTENITFNKTGKEITGSTIKRTWTSEYLNSLSDELVIIKNAGN